ncbi:OmpA family protein [Parasaccharibacter apium]|uniref:OmpA family protein n=1 Tax=Parasaccharibacter apium TaxID=1510841 RepID=UPI0009DAA49C|nr:OmpA family protein [Parasaccharibacter apium]
MKNRLASLFPLLCTPLVAGLLCAPAVRAQVSTNLDALPEAAPATQTPRQSARQENRTVTHPAPVPQAPPVPPGYTRVPSIAAEAPKPTVITPPEFPVILHPAVPAADVQPDGSSHSHTEPQEADSLRILFDTGSTGLNATTIESIRHYAETMAPKADTRFVLRSYATVPGSDISAPRRLALSRALAVRGLLVRSGIATTRIYPIAQGRPDSTDTAPADRLDILPEANPSPSDSPEKGNTAP